LSSFTGRPEGERSVVQDEFERAAPSFSARTKGRFDHMDVVPFSRVAGGDTVLEVGSGTGNFLALFKDVAGALVGVDLTIGMLRQAQAEQSPMRGVQADGNKLPFASRSFDLVCCAQMLHHVWEPVPLLKEMRRVVKPEGHVLVVDQVAPESYEQTAFMNELEALRDPSHATSRSPSVMVTIVRAAGLEVVDDKIVGKENSLSSWMWPDEFPHERIQAVKEFIDKFGHETGMQWRKQGDDWIYYRERMMILAAR
jgi:SAM-dependent methyltransferase